MTPLSTKLHLMLMVFLGALALVQGAGSKFLVFFEASKAAASPVYSFRNALEVESPDVLDSSMHGHIVQGFMKECRQVFDWCELVHELHWINALSVRLSPAQHAHRRLRAISLRLPSLVHFRKVTQVGSHALNTTLPHTETNLAPSFQTRSPTTLSASQLDQIKSTWLHQHHQLTGKNVTILILDSGFDWRYHQAFNTLSVRDTWDFIRNDSRVWQEDGDHSTQYLHGTKVLGLMGANHDSRYYGNAYDANFLLAKTEDVPTETLVEEDNFVAALQWGYKRGANIMTASLGYAFQSKENRNGEVSIATQGINAATKLGMFCVVSVGNDGRQGPQTLTNPADAFMVLSVGAVDMERNLAPFSSRGPTSDARRKPELVAPGVSNMLVDPSTTSDYTSGSGTSYSAPLVAGMVAQLFEAYPLWRNHVAYVRTLLLDTADVASEDGADNLFGYGIANGQRAFEQACTTERCIQSYCREGRCDCFAGFVSEYCVVDSSGESTARLISSYQQFIIIGMLCMLQLVFVLR